MRSLRIGYSHQQLFPAVADRAGAADGLDPDLPGLGHARVHAAGVRAVPLPRPAAVLPDPGAVGRVRRVHLQHRGRAAGTSAA